MGVRGGRINRSGLRPKTYFGQVILCMIIACTLAGGLTNAVRLCPGEARPTIPSAPRWYGLWYQDNGYGEYKFHAFPWHTATR